MTIWDLYEYLQKEGHEKLLQMTESGFSILDNTIERTNNGIRVCIKERGAKIETQFDAADEVGSSPTIEERQKGRVDVSFIGTWINMSYALLGA